MNKYRYLAKISGRLFYFVQDIMFALKHLNHYFVRKVDEQRKKKSIYGRNKTIWGTKLLNIEIDKKTGEVVSVWFRCLALPFDVTKVEKDRSEEMKRMYKENKSIQINAVEIIEEA